MSSCLCRQWSVSAAIVMTVLMGCRTAHEVADITLPEQRQIAYRSPASLPATPLPTYSPPRTVTNPDNGQEDLHLSLDEAIHIALANAEVIRVLGGFTATSTGSTIYDPGIANTSIDQARGQFDPTLSVNNTFSQNEQPNGFFTPGPPGAGIAGTQTETCNLDATLSDKNALGGTAAYRLGVTNSDIEPGLFPLNPQVRTFNELSYVQPLLQGGGIDANIAPILIASIETEQSFFRFKGSVQQLVRSTIEGYWALVFARTDLWARQQQVEQLMEAYRRAEASQKRGLLDAADVAQTSVALASFKANLISAKANVLQREGALLNVLGISPTDVGEVIPTTPPHKGRIDFEWFQLVSLAEQYRPDIVELKLIIEADSQRVISAENFAQPQLDAVASYRWDGLNGKTPSGPRIGTGGDEYTNWTLGVNFSVPLGLRQSRAAVRQQELLVLRDRANLEQGLHSAAHRLALSTRNLDQYYEQYEAYIETRTAAEINLDAQYQIYRRGLAIFLNVLQAITDWGNAVSSEAQALAQYNTELATMEAETGTILESHGIRFVEERFAFVGPLGCFHEQCYPSAISPTENDPRYPVSDKPAEEAFDLKSPVEDRKKATRPLPPIEDEDLKSTPGKSLTPDELRELLNEENSDKESSIRNLFPSP
ncbi:MAG: TolC family protein [Planctomycetaceae bacterium]